MIPSLSHILYRSISSFIPMLCLLIGINGLASTSANAFEFLPVDKAFQTNISVQNGHIKVKWTVTPEHYLYEPSLSLSVSNADRDSSIDIPLGQAQITPQGKAKNDEFMGDVVVHEKDVTLSRSYQLEQSQDVIVTAKFQGCAEAGLCYPPKKFTANLTLPSTQNLEPTATAPTTSQSTAPSTPATPAAAQTTLETNALWYNLAVFFGLGLLLSLTPCVLPMVPILSSIILGSNKAQLSARRGFGLSTSYVLGMALIYTIAGLLVALSGSRLQIYLQQPFVLWPLASLFVILAASLLGAFELRLPSGLHNKMAELQSKLPGGEYFGVFLIGAMSAVVVSPCVSAPLAGILLFIAQEGDAWTGGLSLFSLALGMGAPLIVLGTTGANILPKAGGWMDSIKAFFGFMMLAMALYVVKHLIDTQWLYLICASLLAFFGVWLGALHQSSYQSPILHIFSKAIGIVSLMLAAMFIFQSNQHIFPATAHASSPVSTEVEMQTVLSLEELDEALAQAQAQGQFAMVDVYADWCVACLELEHKTFTVPEVKNQLEQMYLIRLDITDNLDTDGILNHLNIIGPPTLLFYGPSGEELTSLRVTGFLDGDAFLEVLEQVFQNN